MDKTTRRHRIGFAGDLELTTGTRRDWPWFARWHYRSHELGIVRFVTVLWHHGDCGLGIADCGVPEGEAPTDASFRNPKSEIRNPTPIGVCVFTSPPISLAGRNRFFGHSGRWSRVKLQLLSRQVVMLSRVVLHPTYRGAGLAAAFVRASCRACRWPWVEALAQMGHVNPFFEKAGFLRVPTPPRKRTKRDRRAHGSIYGGKQGRLSEETHRKSRYADPVYYVFDNRDRVGTTEHTE